jgi:hypothetical protein
MDAAARGGSHGYFRISPMFVAMATVTRPARAADAPAVATSRSFHASRASKMVMDLPPAGDVSVGEIVYAPV